MLRFVSRPALVVVACIVASCGRVGFELESSEGGMRDAGMDAGFPDSGGPDAQVGFDGGADPDGGAATDAHEAAVADAGDAGADAPVCGDGVVSPDAGETCEPEHATSACPTECDDADSCTTDSLSGTPQACDATCSHQAVELAAHGDGCCPPGANASDDDDCASVCGNGIVEPGEACDGGPICEQQSCALLFDPSLIRRYSFDGSGTTAVDSIAGANATVVSSELTGSGALRLRDGPPDQYVDLPNGSISSLVDATVEVWVTWNGTTQDHARIFDFGSNPNGEGNQAGTSTGYFYLTPAYDDLDRRPQLSYSATGMNPRVALSSVEWPSGIVHVAAVFDDRGNRLRLYINGVQRASTTVNASLSSVDDYNAWVGRSQFSDDPDFDGIIYEFRIYDSALDAAAIAASYAAGSDPQ
jgi:hypothetical protein